MIRALALGLLGTVIILVGTIDHRAMKGRIQELFLRVVILSSVRPAVPSDAFLTNLSPNALFRPQPNLAVCS